MTPRDLKDFGSAAYPLRASGLHGLVACTLRAGLEYLEMKKSESRKSADTGSAAHFAIANLHRGETETRAVAGMAEALGAFPLADLHQAGRIVEAYWADPRNRDAEFVTIKGATAVEVKVAAVLLPWEGDSPAIVIHGTADQIRIVDGVAEVWDVKTGDRDAVYMQQEYAFQLAAYSIGFGETARPGGLIRTKGYFTRGAEKPSPRGVFIPACIPDASKLLDAVRLSVHLIRNGAVTANPGSQCDFCPFTALEYCQPKLITLSL